MISHKNKETARQFEPKQKQKTKQQFEKIVMSKEQIIMPKRKTVWDYEKMNGISRSVLRWEDSGIPVYEIFGQWFAPR